MAYEHKYHRDSHNPMAYGDLENSSVSSRSILITLAVIGLIVAAIFLFSSVSTTSIDSALTGSTDTLSTTPAPNLGLDGETTLPGTQPTPMAPVQ